MPTTYLKHKNVDKSKAAEDRNSIFRIPFF